MPFTAAPIEYHEARGKFLKVTVGYGHEPLRTILWMLAIVLLGAVLVSIGARAGVWPHLARDRSTSRRSIRSPV